MPPNDVSSGGRGLNFSLGLHIHQYFVYSSSEGSGESVHLHRLARAFVTWQCDKYRNLTKMCWLILFLFRNSPILEFHKQDAKKAGTSLDPCRVIKRSVHHPSSLFSKCLFQF